MSKEVTLPVLIAGLQSKVDGSIKITLETRELNPNSAANLFEMRNREAWAVLAPNRIEEVNLPKEQADATLQNKTPSQRLRNVLYILWKQNGSQGDFESYYKTQMEKMIEKLKDKIEE